ncbi:protein-tyrosine-phosphatase [Eikenella sp. NML96-A-049]|uniref:low molecular weight protein-tyrosine-phosphatase n=1 Tax=unclassified Eikenella TaxID=2639367 RepID=UPI0007DFA68D|nr:MULTISPECIES: low molecular weight protein-tyrosine-phosphatase [unclassified Eikenella]OAM35263.1 protein-tyrosine-phosphatase [Eikenella sp. NML070372]OAM40636.1 protein-tyrosine-phosphatase [Eikenella sp. NML96-A-049]VDH01412.1 CiaB protein [Helicobacter pametensis]
MERPVKVLFVCLGNICRSPMAEYLCRSMAAARGLPVHTASAGTSGWHDGEGMHCGSLEILSDEGIDSSGFVSRRVRTQDLAGFDYLLAMDDDNLAELEQRFGCHPGKIFKITDLLPDSGYSHVPDPWYTGNFNETCRILTACCTTLLDKIEKDLANQSSRQTLKGYLKVFR